MKRRRDNATRHSCAWGIPEDISVIYVLLPARKSRYMQLGRWDITKDLAKWHTSLRVSHQFTCYHLAPWILNLAYTPLRYTVFGWVSCDVYFRSFCANAITHQQMNEMITSENVQWTLLFQLYAYRTVSVAFALLPSDINVETRLALSRWYL